MVSLDHYVGRSVTAIRNDDDGPVIVLDGTEVKIHDPLAVITSDLMGKQLMTVILGQEGGVKTRMIFSGGYELHLPAVEYSIFDPNRGMEEPEFPQRAKETPIPPEPVERITE